MRRLTGAFVLAGLVGALFVATAGPAGAASARGCSGSGRSISADGDVIDRASAPGGGGTKSDPFTVETKGQIAYDYSVNRGALSGGKWTASIDTGLPIPGLETISFSGDIEAGSSQSGDGVEPLEEHLQVGGLATLAGKLQMTIKARAGGVNCTVVGWIEIKDSPVKSIMFIEAIILLILAFLFFWFAMMGVELGEMEEVLAMGDTPGGKK